MNHRREDMVPLVFLFPNSCLRSLSQDPAVLPLVLSLGLECYGVLLKTDARAEEGLRWSTGRCEVHAGCRQTQGDKEKQAGEEHEGDLPTPRCGSA